jgi:hypothetical protein
MTRMTTAPLFLGVMALTFAGCSRSDTTEDRSAPAANEAQARQNETMELDNRLAAVEHEWQEVQAALSRQASAVSAEVKTRVQDDLKDAREAIAELRTTTAENWWERQERQIERAAENLEQDVRRYARNWKAPDTTGETGTAGETSDWHVRRDQLIARMQARIEALEAALRDVSVRDADKADVEDTRMRVKQLREDTGRLRDTTEQDWWDVTTQRLERSIERIDAAIDRITNNRG